MGRPSACNDPSLWPKLVRKFLMRQAQRRLRPLGGEIPQPEPDRRLKQSAHERRIRVLAAQSGDAYSPKAASAVLAYWQWCLEHAGDVDQVVLDYLEWARQRYCADPRRDIAKALGLVLPTAGAPGVLMRKNKSKGSGVKATPDALIEAVTMYEELRRDRDPKKRLHKNAVEAVVAATGVSRPVLLKAVAKQRPKISPSKPKSDTDVKTVTLEELPQLFEHDRAGDLMQVELEKLASMVFAAGGPALSGDNAAALYVGWLIKHTDIETGWTPQNENPE